MRKILVTGGLGFIGSHTVVELLEQGYDVLIADDLSNSRYEVLEGIEKIAKKKPAFEKVDVSNVEEASQLFQQYAIASIIHFAAFKAVGESVEYPLKYYRNNLISLINLLELSKSHGVLSFIFSSSCTVYGEPSQLPVTEDSPIEPAKSPYGNTKQIGEEIIRDFVASSKEFSAISLRYFNPIGAHESALIGELPLGVPSNLVPFITQTAAGIREKLFVFGDDYDTPDGTCVRDYVHVVDLAKAHIKAMEYSEGLNSKYLTFNVGTGKGVSVLEVIRTFETVTGKKIKFEIVDRRPGDVEKTYADTTKANDVLRWRAERNLEAMLRTAWAWESSLHSSKTT